MEKVRLPNSLEEKSSKMTLKDYYLSLPDASYPKTEFINKIALETGVTASTVRNWIKYGMKPNSKEHVAILSRETGIPEDELWEE